MTTTPRSDAPHPSGTPLFRSLLYWDLGIALALGTAAGVIWQLTDYDHLRWGSFVVPIPLAVTLAVGAWHQRTSLRDRLHNTPIGEAVRILDGDESELTRSFSIVITISLIAAVAASLSAFFIETIDSEIVQAVIVAVNTFLLGWSLAGFATLVIHTGNLGRLAARIESVQEDLAAAEREDRRTRRNGYQGE